MHVKKSNDGSSLVEVIDRILDKGIVIDVYARISVLGLEVITVEARIVVSSIETWLRYADAVDLLKNGEDEPDQGGPKELLDRLLFPI
ncbi:gas vesicle structural protein GvpA [Metabacillus idriensis]|uniref:Gas vesicle protein A n=1 Tax=Metabacillus idriensis TaxID=324768 RepID=A0A6I2MHN9_9BACI|nr:gas vesicle structural protein GvpA [Metabacillus idriensis]MCM3596034.1 gas vesicle structural protein GvpA [Metabacillus idriensis]MRX56647.1 gas vesicle structural protein GvpA [Metabacillus idriensis]OHR64104.1 gas vesicle protein GvpA [Bacillus sp. HMSC76G11]